MKTTKRSKTAKLLTILIAIVMVLGVISGCSNSDGTSQTTTTTTRAATTTTTQAGTTQATETEPTSRFTTDNITLTQWTFINPADASGRGKVLNDFINKFQDEYPNVKIQTEVQQWNQLLSLQTAAFFAGNEPDVMWNSSETISGIIAIGALEPFENMFLDEWSEEQTADISDALWGSGTTDGNHYFFAISRSPFGIAYRADLFEKYNVPTEFDDITDFFEALKVFNGVVENGITMWGYGTGYNPSSPPDSWLSIGLASAGELFNEDGTAKFATAMGVYLLDLQRAMIDSYKITPPTTFAYDNEAIYNDFVAGRYAAIPTSAARVRTIRNNAAFDPLAIQVMPYPSLAGHPSKHITGGWCIGVSSNSDYKYEAGKFVELLGGPELDWALANEAGQLAVRQSTYDKYPEFFAKPENQYIVTFKEIMDNNIYPITPFPAVGLKETLLEAFTNYYVNNMPAMEALRNAENEFNDRNDR